MNTKVKFSGRLCCLECGKGLNPEHPGWDVELCPKHLEESEIPNTKKCSGCGKLIPASYGMCRLCESKEKFSAMLVKERLLNYGIPPKTAKAVSENIDIDSAIHLDESLFICGTPGSGKTYLATQVLYQSARAFACDHNRFKPDAKIEFITCPELLNRIRAGFSKGKSDELLERYKTLDLLVLDDLGVEQTTDWTLTTLYMILAHRYEYDLTTIITANLGLAELAAKLGDERLTSRIGAWCKVIPMMGGDRR